MGWMGSYTPRPLYPQDKSHRYRLTITLGGPQSRSGPSGKEKDPLFQPGFEHDSWESSPRSSRYIDHTIPALAGRTKHEIARRVFLSFGQVLLTAMCSAWQRNNRFGFARAHSNYTDNTKLAYQCFYLFNNAASSYNCSLQRRIVWWSVNNEW
jgi:hypothetical protein